jgi:AcrR family transcriptional regulator
VSALRADARRNLARVLEVAGECFAERGLDVSVDEIARRAGVGHGTVFRHFPTKDALVAAVIRVQLADAVETARDALEQPDAGVAFEGFFRHLAEAYARNHYLVDGLELCPDAPEKRELETMVRKLVEQAQEAGALRRDVSADDVLMLVPTAARFPQIVLDGLRAAPIARRDRP